MQWLHSHAARFDTLARTGLRLVLDPTLILLDEPSIGLDPKSRQAVFASIRRLADDGRTVLLVEQNARSGLAAADFGAVLEGGVVRLTATGESLLGDAEVARLYLGAGAVSVGATGQTASSSPTEGEPDLSSPPSEGAR